MTPERITELVENVVAAEAGKLAQAVYEELSQKLADTCRNLGGGNPDWDEFFTPALIAGTMKHLATRCDEGATLWRAIYWKALREEKARQNDPPTPAS